MHLRGPCVASLLGATLQLSACDIVQGFRNADDALRPREQTYLDAPGLRLLAGGYRRVHFSQGPEIYLVARSSDASDHALYATPYAAPGLCSIPNVGSYQPGEGTFQGPSIISYLERDAPDGALHFADTTCHVYDYAVPGGAIPYVELEHGFVVLTGPDLLLVNPVAARSETIATSVEAVYPNVLDGFSILQTAGTFAAYRSSEWATPAHFGDAIANAGTAGGSLFFEDRAGIHRLTSSGGDNPTLSDEIVEPGGCQLGFSPPVGGAETWLTWDAPCAEGVHKVYGAWSQKASKLDRPDDAQYIAFAPAWPKSSGDPAVDPFYLFYLKNMDAAGLGTLFVRTPEKHDYTIGERAALDRVTVIGQETGTYGYALVSIDGDAGRYVGWQAADGSVETLASGVRRSSDDLLANYDGHKGDFALTSGGALITVAKDVPAGYYRFRDQKGRWSGLLHDYDGSVATLSITDSTLDRSQAASAVPAWGAPTLTPIATRVAPDSRAHFLTCLPGAAYLASYDPQTGTGQLAYRNLELAFTATVSEGVSDYVSTTANIIYSVPFGEAAGIWVVRAR
jgi:hypothetical protein